MTDIGNKHRYVFFYALFIILIIISIYITLPLLKYVLMAIILTFILKPIYDRLIKVIRFKWISAIIITTLVLLLFILPFIFFMDDVIQESNVAYISIKQVFLAPINKNCPDSDVICKTINGIRSISQQPQVNYYLLKSINKMSETTIEKFSNFLSYLPKFILGVFIMLLSLFYFLIEGDKIVRSIRDILPMSKSHFENLSKTSYDVTKSIINSYFLTATSQGLFALIGFITINIFFAEEGNLLINAPLFWTILLIFFSMIPFLGSTIIWLPLSITLIAKGISETNNSTLYAGIFLFFYGLLIISQIDNIIRPYITSKKIKIHPLVIYVGMFGGLLSFGITGILIGPLILALFISYLKLYKEGKL